MRPATRYLSALVLLFVSLFIYLCYRTERTAVNTLAQHLLGKEAFAGHREVVRVNFPLPAFVVFSLPEMLWTAAFTLLAGGLYVRIFRKNISCIWIPLLIAAGLELLQWIPDFPGRFDWLDLLGAILAWALAAVFISGKTQPAQNLFGKLNVQRLAFVSCYGLMFLAHVWL